jgi:hypothetical protein
MQHQNETVLPSATSSWTSCCLGCTSKDGPKAAFLLLDPLDTRTCFWHSFGSHQQPKQTEHHEQSHDCALKGEDAADGELNCSVDRLDVLLCSDPAYAGVHSLGSREGMY